METKNEDFTMVGKFISAHRNDGRFFCGTIVKTCNNVKGTLVVVENNGTHKSFYMEDLQSHYIADSSEEKFISYANTFRQVCENNR